MFVGDDEFQSIEVKATVTNRGRDPSYATTMYTSYPEKLLDLSINSHERVSLLSALSSPFLFQVIGRQTRLIFFVGGRIIFTILISYKI